VKIAILGTRGIPANYGGFETFAEECGARLASRGHDVTVYCRAHYVPAGLNRYRGVRLVVLPTLRWKYTDTVVHTFLSSLHALLERYDAILICNAANSIFAAISRLGGAAVAVNVDGIERHRQKWNWLGKLYYRISERLSIWLPHAMITDARCIERYYRHQYRAPSFFIPYGAITERPETCHTLDALALSPGGYFLYVSRFEPENNVDLVVRAFEKVRTEKRLVLVGDAPYSKKYMRKVKETNDPRILFPGAIYGTGYRELQANAFCYIHATEVGGTHPALIEAMGLGNIIIANGTPENIEVTGEAGIVYRKNDAQALTNCLQKVADSPSEYACLKETAVRRAKALYSWENVVSQYEELFAQLVRAKAQA
jgi:glycosyltransferase involved in cell wall biosynthesis